MQIGWIGSLILLESLTLAQTPPLDVGPRFDAHRLQLGTFRYSDSSHGKVIGESKIRVLRIHRSEGQEYVFSNVVEGASDQHWKAVIFPNFRPISAELTFGGS